MLLRTAGGREKMLTLRREALAPRDPLRLLDAAGAGATPIRAAILDTLAGRGGGEGLERALRWAAAREDHALAGAIAGLLAAGLDHRSATAVSIEDSGTAGAAALRWYEWIVARCGDGVDPRQEVTAPRPAAQPTVSNPR